MEDRERILLLPILCTAILQISQFCLAALEGGWVLVGKFWTSDGACDAILLCWTEYGVYGVTCTPRSGLWRFPGGYTCYPLWPSSPT